MAGPGNSASRDQYGMRHSIEEGVYDLQRRSAKNDIVVEGHLHKAAVARTAHIGIG